MSNRTSEITRNTAETKVFVSVMLDGTGKSEIDSGAGFLDHMLTLLASHGRFDLTVRCNGDTNVDYHHSAEDIGIALGSAFKIALADKRGIRRFGEACIPMDEALVLCSVDISGRDALGYGLKLPTEKIGDFDTELFEEFFLGFVRNCGCALHFVQFSGMNSHHIIEGAFKAFARAMKTAVSIDPSLNGEIPSTKGVL